MARQGHARRHHNSIQGGVHHMVNADSIFDDVAKLMITSMNDQADTVLGALVEHSWSS
jgi:hypothetical protein